MTLNKSITIGKTLIKPGERKIVHLNVASLYDYTQLKIPVEVICGKNPGPVLFISAAIHGDEINGVEIVRRILNKKFINNLNGTLIAVPIVNVFGFNNRSRYLPDRRDLNRCFPGSKNGSLASNLAHIFMKEIVRKCTHGIDLHTGAIHRSNLPQVRACIDDPETLKLANDFGVPVIIHSATRDGSLREAARKKKIPMLLFEGGEALRFEESIIKSGVNGCQSVMKNIGMLEHLTKTTKTKPLNKKTFIASHSIWKRAPHSGCLLFKKKLGDNVKVGDVLAIVSDPFGKNKHEITSQNSGIIIGITKIPLVNKGDAVFHTATFTNSSKVKHAIDLSDYSS